MRRAVAVTVLALSCSFPVPFASAIQITEVIPSLGPTAGGITVTLIGSGFSPTDSVVIGSGLGTCEWVDITLTGCTLPPGTGPSHPIRVIDNNTGESSPPFPFGYLPPTITAVTAASVPTAGGIPITIDGENFGTLDGEHRVVVGSSGSGRSCSSVHVETPHTRVTCMLPPGVGANVPIDITVNGQTSAASSLSYDPPAITAVTPTRASAAGGAVVTLTGTNFGEASSVTVGGSSCPIEEQGHSELTCVLPPSSVAPPNVVVVTGGQVSNAAPFSYELAASKCDAAKWKSALALASCVGKVASTGTKKGLPRDPAALTKCDEKFDASCAKAELNHDDCSQPGTCDAIASATSRGPRRKGWDGTIKGRIE